LPSPSHTHPHTQAWLGIPCIYVLDCSAAGFIVNSFKAMVDNRQAQLLLQQQAAAAAAAAGDPGAAAAAAAGLGSLPTGPGDPMKEVIVLAACQGNELLPQVRVAVVCGGGWCSGMGVDVVWQGRMVGFW
jgi:hypothetical protein